MILKKDGCEELQVNPRKWLDGLLALLGAVALAGCASVPPVAQAPGFTRVDLAALPAPAEPFLLQPFDQLSVTVFGQPDFNREVEISAAGEISLPLIGNLPAAGINAAELEDRIEDRLRGRYIRDPAVSVILDREASQQIYVGGEVKRAGSFGYRGDITLQRAVVLAGGVTTFAKEDDVLVQREVDGQTYIGVYNITAIQRGNYPDPRLYPGDTVTVGDSPGRRQLLEILQILPAILQPLILIERVGAI